MSDNSYFSDNKIEARKSVYGDVTKLDSSGSANESESVSNTYERETILINNGSVHRESVDMSMGSETTVGRLESTGFRLSLSTWALYITLSHRIFLKFCKNKWANKVVQLLLMQQAGENGSALVLDEVALDADGIYERSVAFAKSAPPRPVFRQRFRKRAIEKSANKAGRDLDVKKEVPIVLTKGM